MKFRYATLLTASVLLATNAYADQCITLKKQAHDGYLASNLSQIKKANQQIEQTDCLGRDKTYVARQLAYLMYNQLAQKNPKGQVLVTGCKQILNHYPKFWPALVGLAEYYDAKKQFAPAALHYEEAIDAINDPKKTMPTDMPSREKIATIYQRADTMKLAADDHIVLSSRGFGATWRNRHLPIHFNSGKNTLTAKGLKYAQDLLKALNQSNTVSIQLIGHTDPVGKEPNNEKLSMARVTTVGKFLEDNGYKGKIALIGKGETDPLADPHDDPKAHYGKDGDGKPRWYGMLRRVQVIAQ